MSAGQWPGIGHNARTHTHVPKLNPKTKVSWGKGKAKAEGRKHIEGL